MRLMTLILALTAAPAAAQSLAERYLAADSACYRRDYSEDHLASHPQQQVAIIALGRERSMEGPGEFVVFASVIFRDRDSAVAMAWCQPGGPGLLCSMEGDAGLFSLEGRQAGALMLRPMGEGMVFEGPQSFHLISPHTGDDRVFMIPPAPASACR